MGYSNDAALQKVHERRCSRVVPVHTITNADANSSSKSFFILNFTNISRLNSTYGPINSGPTNSGPTQQWSYQQRPGHPNLSIAPKTTYGLTNSTQGTLASVGMKIVVSPSEEHLSALVSIISIDRCSSRKDALVYLCFAHCGYILNSSVNTDMCKGAGDVIQSKVPPNVAPVTISEIFSGNATFPYNKGAMLELLPGGWIAAACQVGKYLALHVL